MPSLGPFELSREAGELRLDGQKLVLRRSAFEILLALAERPGEVLPKRLLCERAWPGRDVNENSLQVEISALRKLLGAGAIATASGRGYQLTLPVGADRAGATPLLGRHADLAAVLALLSEGGLVTLVGEGGIGKTRLAQAVVTALAAAREWHTAPAVTVALDEVRSAEGVRSAVASALRLASPGAPVLDGPDGADPPMPVLSAALASWRGLVVFDGCDGVLHAVADLVAATLARAPQVKLLVTSREALRVPGEQCFALSPLAAEAAGALFLRHAQGRIPGPELATLCQSLAGHPLAIVLAAASLAPWRDVASAAGSRDAALPAATSSARLDVTQCLDWRAPASTSTSVRHHNLMASFECSWVTLSAAERTLLERLAGLPTPFRHDDVVALAPGANRWDLVETLGRLVDKSLVLLEAEAPERLEGPERDEPPAYRLGTLTRLCLRRRLVA